jgi:hypothetical protein
MNLLVEKVKTEGQPFLAGDHTFWQEIILFGLDQTQRRSRKEL